jgi:hypothetical protein
LMWLFSNASSYCGGYPVAGLAGPHQISFLDVILSAKKHRFPK